MLLLDGAYGTLLAPALRGGEVVDELCEREPARVIAAHADYIAAGAGGVQTNSFLAWRFGDRRREAIYTESLACAREAAAPAGARVTATIGPAGNVPSAFYRDLEQLLSDDVTYVLCETVTDVDTANAFIRAWEEVAPGAPAQATLSMSVAPSRTPSTWLDEIDLLRGDDADAPGAGLGLALGLNCCEGPTGAGIRDAAARIAALGRPWQLVPSAGLPSSPVGEAPVYPLDAAAWAEAVQELVEHVRTAEIESPAAPLVALGGCCGTTPAYVQRLQDARLAV